MSQCAIFTTDESICSDLSSESCEYYQTEIYEQLPSVQASRAEQNRLDVLESSEVNQGGSVPEASHGRLPRGQRDKVSMQPLKNMPLSIQAKRDARWENLIWTIYSMYSIWRPFCGIAGLDWGGKFPNLNTWMISLFFHYSEPQCSNPPLFTFNSEHYNKY